MRYSGGGKWVDVRFFDDEKVGGTGKGNHGWLLSFCFNCQMVKQVVGGWKSRFEFGFHYNI